ncbi:MAG: ABC transporter ATP-binding protein, partial [Anaerolineales bacterium]
VNLAIEQNTFCLVMGPSGSGKSTLLYLLGGLDRPSAGQIRVDGQAIEGMDENKLARYRRYMVGIVFQSFNLVPSMTALENVAFPMRFNGVSRRKRKERALELLARVGLEERAYHKPTELSGGEQQRIAIARAMVNSPQIIMADEPTGNLDTASGNSIMQVLADLHRNGATIVMVTHDTRLVQYATRLVQLLDGRIVNQAPG